MEEARYNLRSSTREEHIIPVQLKMHTDQEFLTQTLGISHPNPRQVSSDQSGTSSGAGFMKGLKSGLRLKSETLGSNIVNILLSLWTQTQSISQTGST